MPDGAKQAPECAGCLRARLEDSPNTSRARQIQLRLAARSRGELYDVNIACEPLAAELLAALPESERCIKADAVDALNATMGLALQENDLVAWAKADDEFHRLLVVSCGNGRFARIAETIMDQSHRARMLSLKWRPIPTKSVEEHQQIVDSIRKGLKIQAHNKARDHRARSRDLLLPLLERFGVKQL